NGAVTRTTSKLLTHRRTMQRHIMKNRLDSAASKMRNHRLPLVERRHEQMEEVVRGTRSFGHVRQLHPARVRPISDLIAVAVPETLSCRLNSFALFELRKQKRGQHVG